MDLREAISLGVRNEVRLYAERNRLRAALDRIANHPQCDRVIKQMALDALEGKTEG